MTDRGAPNDAALRALYAAQRNELTEHEVYRRLALRAKNPANREVLERIAADELAHSEVLAKITGRKAAPVRRRVFKYVWLSRLLGVTFGVKLMERGELHAERFYRTLVPSVPELAPLVEDERRHESELTDMLDEERLRYIGSVVLGLNDALVEFTGALAGLTFALPGTRLVGMAGLVTGIAAALSMGASEYLSTKAESDDAEGRPKSPFKAAVYTSATYLVSVAALVAPYLLLRNPYACLGIMIGTVALLIFLFTYYVSVAKGLPFWRRFGEMLALSIGVAGVSFGIGTLARLVLGVEV